MRSNHLLTIIREQFAQDDAERKCQKRQAERPFVHVYFPPKSHRCILTVILGEFAVTVHQ